KRPPTTPKYERPTKHHYPSRSTTTETYEEHPSLNEIGLYSDSGVQWQPSIIMVVILFLQVNINLFWRQQRI
ncbi:protein CEPU-1-like, partial [Tropilaelaps mercedesae]